jgi:hypothetical protein
MRKSQAKGGPEKAPAKKAPKAMPVPGAADATPGAFAWTASLDALYARGWPHLRVLTDEPVAPRAARKQALAALQAIDPYLPTIVPREVARLVLTARTLHAYEEVPAIEARMEEGRVVDEHLLREVLRVRSGHASKLSETYPFRMEDDVLLFEAFLGTEVVAEALRDHLLAAMRDPAAWGDSDFWIDHPNANPTRVAPVLGWLRHRMPEARWRALVEPLREGHPRLPKYSATLRAIADDAAPAVESFDPLAMALQRGDAAAVRAIVGERFPFDDAPRAAFVAGPELLLDVPVADLARNPKWHQERLVAEIGTIRAPGAARVIGALLGSRAAGPLAGAWVDAHRAWVEAEALPVLAARTRDAAVVRALRAHLAGEVFVAPSKAEMKKDLAALFRELPAAMRACEDDPARERAAMTAAFDRYCALRAAVGEVIPEAYFTHQLDLAWGADEARVTRWIDLAVDVA